MVVLIREPRLLDGSLDEVRRIHPVSFSVTENSTPLSTASIQLKDGDSVPERAWVEMYTPNGSAGVYRVRTPQKAYGDQVSSVELEHGITEVGDYLVKAEIQEDMALNSAIQTIFGHYTESAGNNAHWQLGANTFTDTVGVDIEYESVLEAMLMLLNQTSYMLSFDFTTSPWTVNIVQADQDVTAEGRLSRNVLSAQVQKDDSELATKVFAAYEVDDGNGELTLAWIYEQDDTAISNYGIVEAKVSETSEDEEAARAAAVKYLNKHKKTKISVSVNGYDFSSVTGESLDQIRVGKKYRLAIEGESDPVEEVIRTITWQSLAEDEFYAMINLAEEDDILIKTINRAKSAERAARRASKKADGLHYAFYSEDGYLRSQFDFTESYFRTAFQDVTNNLRSEVEQTASYWRSTYEDTYNGLVGQVEQTASYWRSTYENWQQQVGIIEQTASYWRATYSDAQNNLGVVEQTASYWRSVYSDAQNNLGQIEQTASYWRSTYQDANSLMGQIEQTASYWRGIYTDTANSLRAEVVQTASEWRTTLINEGSNQRSSIIQTAASMTFTADQIYLNGDTKISDILGINGDGYLTVDGDIFQSGTMYTANVTIGRLGALSMWTGNPGDQVSVHGADLENMIIKADVDNDVLYLWKRGENTSSTSGILSFKKAVTLQGTWSNGVYSVSATSGTITGTAPSTQIQAITPVLSSVVSRSGKYVSRPFQVDYGPDGEHTQSTEYEQNISINAESVYNYGWNEARGDMVIPTADIGSYIDGAYSKFTVEKPDADGANTTTGYEYSLDVNSSFRPSGTTSDVYAVEIKYGNNVVARKTISVSSAANYDVTGGSVVIKSYSSVSGFTKTTYSNRYYYLKDGTSGMSKVVKFYAYPRLTVDGNNLNYSDEASLANSFESYATDIYREGYRDGTNDAGGAGAGYNSGWLAAAAACSGKQYAVTVTGHGEVDFDYNPTTRQAYNIGLFKIMIPSDTVDDVTRLSYYLTNTKNTTYVRYGGTSDSDPIIAGLTHNQYNEAWSAARAKTSGTFTATVEGTSYEFPYLPVDTPANLKPVFGVALPSTIVDNRDSYYYYLSSDNDVAYLRYASQSGVKVAQYQHNKYTSGWNAARAQTSGTYTATVNSESRTYPYLPTDTPANMGPIMGVAIPSSTVGSRNSYYYYLTSDDDTCYIRYASQSGVKVAQYNHNKFTSGKTAGINSIHHLTLDGVWDATNHVTNYNHAGNFWNVRLYNSSNVELRYMQTNQSSTGLIIPTGTCSKTISSNGTETFWPALDGLAVYDKVEITVSVPTGGGTVSHGVSVSTDTSWYAKNTSESNAKYAAAYAMGINQNSLNVKKISSSPTNWCWFKAKCSGGGSWSYYLIGF